ncbi:MAG: nucleotide pyrophosphohydrolase [Gammaproteobacteria bacterium]|nr:nucleotide pyrophosphohydrolase [Gammaproteobacteria bacterium]MBT8150106.1 nucleotide pyrophosphohydrolase [Gammaproteobacteria bacterium]NND39694.1 nucleotide pyrophosphohydrolase [Pseudomonadales bacterium]NNL10564.1 nucleotide pyrophosphohydrolase [Pseudomonadales bacterium]RZV52174.1 MAG: nucleotide pyrophosphohydrolase [Pseudomonadales bacterium]
MKSLEDIRQRAAAFAAERDWQQFQSPKNLAMALSVEVSELLEHFQWLSEAQSRELDAEQLQAVADEIADVQLYLVRLADELGVDILQAVARKAVLNEAKYPADQVRGSAKKYDRYK